MPEEVYKLSYQHRNGQQAGHILHKGLKIKWGQKEGSSPEVIFREERKKYYLPISRWLVWSLSCPLLLIWAGNSPQQREEASGKSLALKTVPWHWFPKCPTLPVKLLCLWQGVSSPGKSRCKIVLWRQGGFCFHIFCFSGTSGTTQCDPSVLPRCVTAL